VGPLTAIVPRARIVRLSGKDYRIGEARLSDLADLQSYLDARWPDPAEGLRQQPEGMTLEQWEAALQDAYDVAEAGPPCWGTLRGAIELASVEGAVEMLRVALRHHHPELTAADVVALVTGTEDRPAMTGEEYAELRRAFFRRDPTEEIEGLLGFVHPQQGTPIGWPQAICEVAEAYHFELRYIYTLTLSEFAALRTGGKPKVSGIPLVDGLTPEKAIEQQKKNFYGPEWQSNPKGGE